MNHPYYHKLKFQNAKETIRSLGLTVPYKKEGVDVECLDFSICNPKEWKKQSELLNRMQFTSCQIEEARFFPVMFDETGDIVQWVYDRAENDDPAFYLSTALPDIVMSFSAYDENGTLTKSGYTKNFETTDKSGKICECMMAGIDAAQVIRVGERYKVLLPIYSVNKMSSIYVDSRQVIPFDTIHNDGQRVTVLFDSVPVPCYTQSGVAFRKENLTGKEIEHRLEQTRAKFVASHYKKNFNTH